jgi:hypothetical protein
LSRKPVVLGSLALVAALAPAHAGTVYVPLTSPSATAGVRYRTEIVVANSSGTPLSFTTAFIPAGSDGTAAGQASGPVTVPARSTFVLTNAAPAGRGGMLEVSGDARLAVTGRLVAVAASGRVMGRAPVPAIGSQNGTAAGAVAQIQGISRTDRGMQQRFGLINLGPDAASCTAAAFRSNGSPVGDAAHFTAPARSQTALPSPLAAAGRTLFADARVEVTCDQPFYPYAWQSGPDAGRAAFLAPSSGLDSQLDTAAAAARLRGDGDGGSGGGSGGGDGRRNGGGGDGEGNGGSGGGGTGGGPVTGQDSLTFSGVFLDAKQNSSTRAFELPLRQGVRYRRITVDFDLYLNQWQSPLFHAVTSLRRNDRTLYYGLILRGDKAKTILDLGQEQMAKGDGPWKQRTQYHLRLVTDAGNRTVTLQLFQGSSLVHTVTGTLVSTDLSVPAGRSMSIDFGIARVADGAYFPPLGWKYSNLKVTAEPL